MPSTRRLANAKRVDLSSVAEGWDGCYALVTKASVDEFAEFTKIDASKVTNLEATQQLIEFVKPHLVGGKVMTYNDAGELELTDISPEDLNLDMELSTLLFNTITGVAPDPKGGSTVTETSPTPVSPTPTTDSTQQ